MSAEAANLGTLAPLRYSPFRILVTGRVINMLGSAIAGLALGFAVLDLNHSVSDVGYIVATRTTFNIVFILFGGVIADRLPRHLLMVSASVVAGASQAAAAALFLSHTATMGILLILASVNGIAASLSQPASSALLPQTVPPTMRKQANALNRLAINAVSIGSLAVAGTLVSVVGSGWCVAFDAATFFIAAVFFAMTRVLPASELGTHLPATDLPAGDLPATDKPKPPNVFTSLHEGWHAFISHTWLWVVVIGFMLFNAASAGGIGVLGLHYADLTIGRKLWSLVLAAKTIGAIAGAFLAMRVKLPRFLVYGTAMVATGALLPFALVFAPNFFVLLVFGFIGGVGMEQFGIAWETTMQENIEPDMLARVYSYDMLGSWIAIPLGQLLIGPTSIAFGARGAMLGVGIVMLIAVAGMLMSKSVRHLKHITVTEPAVTGPPESVPVLVPIDADPEPQQIYS